MNKKFEVDIFLLSAGGDPPGKICMVLVADHWLLKKRKMKEGAGLPAQLYFSFNRGQRNFGAFFSSQEEEVKETLKLFV